MKYDKIPCEILSMRMVPNVNPDMIGELKLPEGHNSIGIFSADNDDVGYIAMDEATKKANVSVVYGETMYCGAGHASSALQGEIIGIISGPSPAEVRSGMKAIEEYFEIGPRFISCNDDDTIWYFAHCISRTGTYLSKLAGIDEGEAMAYFVAAPLEFNYALDAALKAADVRLVTFIGPPTNTNCGCAFVTGTQSACQAACDAFGEAVLSIAENPLNY